MAVPAVLLVGAALWALLRPTGAFNLHPTPHRILEVGGTHSFGHGVLALPGARVLVGAPGVGRLYGCHVRSGNCTELELWGNGTAAHMGMALTRHGDAAIACGPGVVRECNRNVHVWGMCAVLGPDLRPLQLLEPGKQECAPRAVDAVFLFDGSGSVTATQFRTVCEFMADAIEQLSNSSFRFAAVQFSDFPEVIFSLRDFAERPRPRELLSGVRQQCGLTATYTAVRYVATHVFTAERGSRPGALRVIIIITDGDATDRGDVREAEERGIVRYVIGVGQNFASRRSRAQLALLSSCCPSADFVTVLDDFERLRGLFRRLQAHIYGIEGAHGAAGTRSQQRFHLELSSAGISAATATDVLLTGAVGADGWAGGLLQIRPPPEKFLPNPEPDGSDAYMGYAVVGLPFAGGAVLAVGAPRHRHVGLVLILRGGPMGWSTVQSLNGTQVGSYFGGALCAVGGAVGALLVGAPMHFDGRRGGRVHVFEWAQDHLWGAGELRGAPGHPLGRFGAALAELGDADGDGAPEVAVGAPLEDGGHGAVYVFNGVREPNYVQRLSGRSMGPGLWGFGSSLDGAVDVTADGIQDLIAGARGAVTVIRSRPIASLWVSLQLWPRRVAVQWGRCSGGGSAVGLRLCFRPQLRSAPYNGSLEMWVRFRLQADAGAVGRARGLLGSGSPLREERLRLRGETHCVQDTLSIAPCPEDPISPLRVAVTVSPDPTDPTDGPEPLLRPTESTAWDEVALEQRCGAEERCRPAVSLRALPSAPLLLGGPEAHVTAALQLRNSGAAAPGTAVIIRHPAGTAVRRAAARGTSAVPISCREEAVTPAATRMGPSMGPATSMGPPMGNTTAMGQTPSMGPPMETTTATSMGPSMGAVPSMGTTPSMGLGTSMGPPVGTLVCHVGRAVLPNTTVALEVTLEVEQNRSWGDAITFQATAISAAEAAQSQWDNAVLWGVPVRYSVGVVATWLEDSTPYLNFTSGRTHSAALRHRYRVQTVLPPPASAPSPSITAFLLLPHTLPHGITWQPHIQVENGTECEEMEEKDDVGPQWGLHQDCAPPHPPRLFRCPIGPHLGGTVLLSAAVQPPPHIPVLLRSRVCSRLWFSVGSALLHNTAQRGGAQGGTELELLPAPPPLPLLYAAGALGGALLLLLLGGALIKCGFFRRRYRQRAEGGGASEDPDGGGGASE